MNDYFAFILAEKASFPIDWMCRQLKVSRASFYRWCVPAKPTPTQVRHDELDAHVVRVYTREKGRAGRDQITTILGQEAPPKKNEASYTLWSDRAREGTSTARSSPPLRLCRS